MSGKSMGLVMTGVFAVLNVAVRAEVEAPTLASGFYGGTFLKNRHLSIDPTGGGVNLGKAFAIRVELVKSLQFDDAVGTTWWIGEPDENCLARLVDDDGSGLIVRRNWDGCPELQVDGCGIVPVSNYSLSSVDSQGDSPTALSVQTTRRPGVKWWADVTGFFSGIVWTVPNGTASIGDVVAVVKSFQDINAFNAAPLSLVDIHPQVPNRIVNFNDVGQVILAFQGHPYPFGCPDDPCRDNVSAPCP